MFLDIVQVTFHLKQKQKTNGKKFFIKKRGHSHTTERRVVLRKYEIVCTENA